jgi:hypothetical protein
LASYKLTSSRSAFGKRLFYHFCENWTLFIQHRLESTMQSIWELYTPHPNPPPPTPCASTNFAMAKFMQLQYLQSEEYKSQGYPYYCTEPGHRQARVRTLASLPYNINLHLLCWYVPSNDTSWSDYPLQQCIIPKCFTSLRSCARSNDKSKVISQHFVNLLTP